MAQQISTIREQMKEIKSYLYSDPDPVANPYHTYYPYFRFDGFSATSTNKKWKTVELENDYMKVTLFPEIGGKIWGAIDKKNGKQFIYSNDVVKFRDISMRGAWTSGGIEYNFGIIGHAPTCATPIDYLTQKKTDGSVSCYLLSYDWITRTVWSVEVNLPKDKAYFTTHTIWYNQSLVDQPYYQWMNAGYQIGKNAEFCFPGNHYIGHDGTAHSFPKDEMGREISWYEKNNFGTYKSYHVLGYYNDYYGVYYHGEDYGSVHQSAYDDKLGMKIWIWGLSREGMVWEDLLTDRNGQYVELQSGRFFNQPASPSTHTPYKHNSFNAQSTDEWTEYWYPVEGIGGISKAERIGALHVSRNDGQINLSFSPTESISTYIKVYNDARFIDSLKLSAKVQEAVRISISHSNFVPEGHLRIVIGNNLLVYSEHPSDFELNRPTEMPKDFDWNSLYGLYTQGEQKMNQKDWDIAEDFFKKVLEKDAYYAPALVRLSSLYYREGRYQESLALSKKALSLNTYDAEANYVYGLCNRALDSVTEAKAAFSIASYSPLMRAAAYEQLGEMYALDKDWNKVEYYATKSIECSPKNFLARQLLCVAYRKMNLMDKANQQIDSILTDMPLYHYARFEKVYGSSDTNWMTSFKSLIRNELPNETYMEMANWYESIGCNEEAMALLSCAENYPIALYKRAYLLNKNGDVNGSLSALNKANAQSSDFVFPFRAETLKALEWAATQSGDWKIKYYCALIYWANKQNDKATELLNSCNPDNCASFYLTRALLKNGEDELSDYLQSEKIKKSWRVGYELINYYEKADKWKEALKAGEEYNRLYPLNYYIGLKYALALNETGRSSKCLTLLNKLIVLPNEGASTGRVVYRAANLYQAIEMLKQGKYDTCLKYISASKLWPENLGTRW
jgi:tetratricopeptide (TPR) repeat protein